MEYYMDRYMEYAKHIRKISDNTLTAYKRDIAGMVEFLKNHGIHDLNHVSFTVLNSYVLELERRGMATASVSRNISAVKSFFSYLYNEKMIENNPAVNIKPPKIVRRTPEILTVEEMDRLLSMPDETSHKGIRDKAMLELLYATGIKVSEIIRLRMKDVNLTMNFITCTDEGRERFVPFGNIAGSALLRYISEARKEFNPAEDYLFLNCDGYGMSRQGFWKIIKQYGKQCGFEDRINPHIFRNSFAAHMIQGGADLKSIQEMMGHADISTTQNYAGPVKAGISMVYAMSHPRK